MMRKHIFKTGHWTVVCVAAFGLLAGCSGSTDDEGALSQTASVSQTTQSARIYHNPGPAPDDPEIILFAVDQDTGIVYFPTYVAGVIPDGPRTTYSAMTGPVRIENAARVAEHSVAAVLDLEYSGPVALSLSAAQLIDDKETDAMQIFQSYGAFTGSYLPRIDNELVKSGEGDALFFHTSLVTFNNGQRVVSYVFGDESIDPGKQWYIAPYGWYEATFSGVWSADNIYMTSSGSSAMTTSFTGDASVSVSFATNSIEGTLTPFSETSTLGPITLSGSIDGMAIDGWASASFAGAGLISGPLAGQFYGPEAEEVGGVFLMRENSYSGAWLDEPRDVVSGGFVAKR